MIHRKTPTGPQPQISGTLVVDLTGSTARADVFALEHLTPGYTVRLRVGDTTPAVEGYHLAHELARLTIALGLALDVEGTAPHAVDAWVRDLRDRVGEGLRVFIDRGGDAS